MPVYSLRDLIAICAYTHPAFCTKGGHWLVLVNNTQECPYCPNPYYCVQ